MVPIGTATAAPTPAAARDKTVRPTRVRGKAAKKRPRSKPDKCQPAADDTEQRILENLADPELRTLTITERCQWLDIGRTTWYRHTSEPLFRARARRAFNDAVADRLGEVLHALVSSSLILGREGYRDRQLYLEMVGHFTPGEREESPKETNKKDVRQLTDDELLERFEGREHLLPVGVLRRLGRDPDARAANHPHPKPGAKDG